MNPWDSYRENRVWSWPCDTIRNLVLKSQRTYLPLCVMSHRLPCCLTRTICRSELDDNVSIGSVTYGSVYGFSRLTSPRVCVLAPGVMTRYCPFGIGRYKSKDIGAWCEAYYDRHDRNLDQRGRDILIFEARLSQPKRCEW